MAGLVEVEPRAYAGGGGCSGRDEDGAVDAARGSAEDAARGASEQADRVGRQRAVAAAGGACVAAGRIAGASCGRVVVRHQRDECACRAGGGAGASGGISIAAKEDEASAHLPMPLLVSGRDEAALRAQAGRYGEWLSRHPEADWSSVVRTAALHRTQFTSRASVSVRDASEAVEALRALGEGRPHAAVAVGEAQIVGGWCSCSPDRAVSGHRWAARCWRSCRCLPRRLRPVRRRCRSIRTGR